MNKFRHSLKPNSKYYIIAGLLIVLAAGAYIGIGIKGARDEKYRQCAEKIAAAITASITQGKTEISITVTEPLDYVAVTDGYDIPKLKVMQQGNLSNKLVDEIIRRNPRSDGPHLHLIINERVAAIRSAGVFYVNGQFQLARVNNGRIHFSFKTEKRKDMFGKKDIDTLVLSAENHPS